MKEITMSVAAGLVLAAIPVFSEDSGSEVDKAWHQRDPHVQYSGSDGSWLKSWHKGEQYYTRSEYQFEGFIAQDPNRECPSWWKRNLASWASDGVSISEKGEFTGKAIAKTVVNHEFPHLCLVREYSYVAGDGSWGSHLMPKNILIKQAIGGVVKSGMLDQKNRNCVIQAFSSNPISAEWGCALSDMSIAWCKKNLGEWNEDGVFIIAGDSAIAKAFGAKDRKNMVNMAVQQSRDFSDKTLALYVLGKKHFRAGEITTIPKADRDPAADVESFLYYLNQASPVGRQIEAALQRESFTPMHDLFGGEKRAVGDEWMVDAKVFNGFLHPDLKGAISGQAILKYEEDQEGEDGYYSDNSAAVGAEQRYDVRKLVVLPSAIINGRSVSTDFSYDETKVGGKFAVRFDPSQSNVEVLVDKISGHVVYAKIFLRSNDVKQLPLLSLTEGWIGKGRASLELDFYGDVFHAGK